MTGRAPGAQKRKTVRVVVHGGEAGARTRRRSSRLTAALAALDHELSMRCGRSCRRGGAAPTSAACVVTTIEDAEEEEGTVEVEDDDDMADAADARCVHVRGWPL